jgi:bleomycin hydrolase
MKTLTLAFLSASVCAASVFFHTPARAMQPGQDTAYVFETIIEIPVTPVKDQHRSGTCWAFAGISFIEAEILRITGRETDLSEMYIVRHAYEDKASRYVRLHGKSNFGPGGQAHDVTNVIKRAGIVPETTYPGLLYGEEKHDHGELDAVLKGFLDAVIRKRGSRLTPVWHEAFAAILDVYFGPAPEKFDWEGETVDPVSFAGSFSIDPDSYIELTSYNAYPYYEMVKLEIPDNWSNDLYFNIPLDDFMQVIDHALLNAYTICWDGDVSDRGFSHKHGLAILPEKNPEDLDGTERARWEKLSESEKAGELYTFDKPGHEKKVDEALRREHFDNYTATDDHLMHLSGMVRDQNGTRYYIIKNSWDDNSNDRGGYLYMSEAYLKLNTVAIMVHKSALPPDLAKRLP